MYIIFNIGDYMNIKTQVNTIKVIAVFATLLWILGIIYTNVYLYIISIILTILLCIIVIENSEKFEDLFSKRNGLKVEDERTKLIDLKSSQASFGFMIGLLGFLAIGIFTLRNSNPEYLGYGYLIIILIIIQILIFAIAKEYYKKAN